MARRDEAVRPGGVAAAGVLALVAAGLAVLTYGLSTTGDLGAKLWEPGGWRRFLLLLPQAGVVALLVPLLCRRRWPLACLVLAGLGLVVLFGVVPVAATAYLATSCWCLGRLCLGRYGERDWPPLAAGVLQTLVGFAALSVLLNVALRFRINTQSLYAVVLAVPLVLARRHLARAWRNARAGLSAPRPQRLSSLLLGAVLLVVLAVHAVAAALPERSHDALGLHLRVPLTVAETGAWQSDPAAPPIRPLTAHWFTTIGHLLGGESVGRLINFLFFGFVLALLFGVLRSRCGTNSALLFTTLFASTPLAFLANGTLGVENVLAAFVLGAWVLAFQRWRELDAADLVALGALLGAAASTVPHGVVFAAVLGMMLLLPLVRRHGLRRGGAVLLPGAVVALLVAVPPYLGAWWAADRPAFAASQRETLPGAVGFHFLVLAVPGLVAGLWRRDRLILFAAVAVAGYGVGACAPGVPLRAAYPVFPLLVVVCSGVGLVSLAGSPLVRRTVVGVGLQLVCLNLIFLGSAGWLLRDFHSDCLFDAQRRRDLVDRHAPERQLVAVVRALEGPAARVAFFTRPAATLPWHSAAFLERCQGCETPERLLEVLRAEGIAYLIVGEGPASYRRGPLEPLLRDHATPIKRIAWTVLYALRP